ncbi:hypothetical protein LIER_17093 [Lithospermum erythrorhizon]|uniref:LNS2/PITP domain-containing protein n=1 Tax=Lithospermum erythrorhizon TaxID=34254 RepID=A0AAV3Q929_LITER
MNAVGKLGSYIGKGVVTVSGPFHPFGGAVDIIVVEQPDGSYKSSPWYVKFGKFQGVLKAKEKIVNINVNGVDLDLHMFLDHRGEAYFLHESDVEEGESMPSSSGEDTDGQSQDRRMTKTRSWRADSGSELQLDVRNVENSQTSSRRTQILRLVFGRDSIKENRVAPDDENTASVVQAESWERAQLAADLLEVKWSTNLDSPTSRCKDGNTPFSSAERISDSEISSELKRSDIEGNENAVLKQNMLHNLDSAETCDRAGLADSKGCHNSPNLQTNINLAEETVIEDTKVDGDLPLDLLEVTREVTSEVNSQPETLTSNSPCIEEVFISEKYKICDAQKIKSESTSPSPSMDDNVTLSCGQVVTFHQLDDEVGPSPVLAISSVSNSATLIEGNQSAIKAEDDLHKPVGASLICKILQSEISEEEQLLFGDFDDFSLCMEEELQKETVAQEVSLLQYGLDSGEMKVIHTNQIEPNKEFARMARSLPNMSRSPPKDDLGSVEPHGSNDGQLNPSREYIENRRTTAAFGDRSNSLDSSTRRWQIWQFPKRSESIEDNKLKSSEGAEENKDVPTVKVEKKKIRALTPTSEQLATLHLKEGRNIITFIFSTPMLGRQQVDARIYLWRWDTRIVISDVDGTITRSDVLGQFMPWVGVDWTQTGVTHLFTAIKENGYQLLFLSARAISQSSLTRQFLFNIKQDGKSLPDGPVVISPDGLFPSLFREGC